MEENAQNWKVQFVEMFQTSQKHLEESISVFKEIKDSANVALLSCNLGKLYRLQAQALAPLEKKEIHFAEWKCYSKVKHIHMHYIQSKINKYDCFLYMRFMSI